jgi:hypothetical protein
MMHRLYWINSLCRKGGARLGSVGPSVADECCLLEEDGKAASHECASVWRWRYHDLCTAKSKEQISRTHTATFHSHLTVDCRFIFNVKSQRCIRVNQKG